jgi:dolichyl-phosphate-mannose--protein O-mannosyl transferase
VVGHRTLYKLAATVMFLYFACLLPSIAFGVLNSKNTNGKIGKLIVLFVCFLVFVMLHIIVSGLLIGEPEVTKLYSFFAVAIPNDRRITSETEGVPLFPIFSEGDTSFT